MQCSKGGAAKPSRTSVKVTPDFQNNVFDVKGPAFNLTKAPSAARKLMEAAGL
jgi:hypothetical protein